MLIQTHMRRSPYMGSWRALIISKNEAKEKAEWDDCTRRGVAMTGDFMDVLCDARQPEVDFSQSGVVVFHKFSTKSSL